MIALLKTQLLVGLNINAWRKGKKRGRHIGMFLLVAFALAPTYIGWIALQARAFRFLHEANLPMQDVQLAGTFGMAMMLTLLAGVPIVYSTLFQSRDLSILLPLPYKPWQIVTAKLTVTYAIELIAAVLAFAPSYYFYVRYGFATMADVPVGIVATLLLPVLPVAVAALGAFLITSVPGIGRNKWLWYALMLTAMMSLSMSFTALTGTAAQSDMTDIVQVRMAQMARMGRLFPGSVFAMRAITTHGAEAYGYLAAYAAVVAAYIATLLVLGQTLYLRPILRGEALRHRTGRKAGAAVADHARAR